jgi:CRISPR-associated protein Cmr5
MTREQDRAAQAFEDISQESQRDAASQKRYATVMYQLIILIRTAGLLQALEFISALTNEHKRQAGERLLNALGKQMHRVNAHINDMKTLKQTAKTAELQEYMLLTREMMATMVWYKRFVQSILKIDASEAMQNDQ